MNGPTRDGELEDAERERARWDARHAEAGPLTRAEVPFLDAIAGLLPRKGRALDLASGRGRVALALARRGLEVTASDISPVGLALAREAAAREGLALDVVCVDLARAAPPKGPFDVISCFDYLDRPLLARLGALLAPGGLAVVEVATVTNLERSAHPSRRFLVDRGELPGLLGGLEVVEHVEDWLGGRHVARLVGRRPSVTP